ncbi:MAG: UDP-2,3-diacylglucosamine diphosphatase [Bacteroidetes bacterium]|nr:UDP-2,3-diacylglucosamine diphosphatase [Bacteroidota bacterium]
MTKATKIYFASDFHLGSPNAEASLLREKKIVKWLNEIKEDATEIYFMGDLFDFWFEYKNAVPKGFIRLQGMMAMMADMGIKIHIFSGNHDMWMRDYFTKEFGATIYHEPIIREIGGKTFYLAHGDGLGPGDYGYKFIKSIFKNPVCQWLFARLHPNFGIGIANYFSRSSRSHTGDKDKIFLGEDKEWLIIHSKEILREKHIDFFIYGHRHYAYKTELGNGSRYINLGDWMSYYTYAVWDGDSIHLKKYEG